MNYKDIWGKSISEREHEKQEQRVMYNVSKQKADHCRVSSRG